MSNRAQVTMLHDVRRSLHAEKAQLSKEKAKLLMRQEKIHADSRQYDETFSGDQVNELGAIDQRLKAIDSRDRAIDDQYKELGTQIQGLGDAPGTDCPSLDEVFGEPSVRSAPQAGVHYIN